MTCSVRGLFFQLVDIEFAEKMLNVEKKMFFTLLEFPLSVNLLRHFFLSESTKIVIFLEN